MSSKDLIMVVIYERENKEIPYTSLTFSGGEEHIRLDLEGIPKRGKKYIKIKTRLTSSKAVMQLLMSVGALREHFGKRVKIHLECDYFPYARQDRVCNKGEAFSLEIMCNLINSLKLDHVCVTDPHSGVLTGLVDNLVVMPQYEVFTLYEDCYTLRPDLVVSPDKGATEKSRCVAQILRVTDVIQASKVRDTLTGNIIETVVEGNVEGLDILIPDDICDGGRTFTELAKVLKKKGAKSLTLYVTHGIFSKGFKVFEGLFDHIITTDSFKAKEDYINDSTVRLTIIEL